ncbi:tRNA pseudouridine(55) synthase TruB [Fusibacter ferrireducens]|uniref:tRNA pseudouridine synthase B n=1 Tax=Fusibacter ferrireducens TaxID=2785058 RepID=A0ABR9ZQ61_9FIRM|nr:tRNA pseudouridine(55) synthase TruB [Fusibacter ferrireducens]MBF4691774.1 tRNA pseudouridine(55) synthase TruB [Fusibacter ferrireducens]
MLHELNGIIVIDKPKEMTSHDVVAILRKKLKTKKIGHTGTLDPMATGVLPICIGRATKIVDFLLENAKGYHCEMCLGSATDTQDRWGTVTHQVEDPNFQIEPSEIVNVIQSFIGEIDQMPPMYSALKVNGEKLVDLARKGIVVERETRKRTIHSIKNINVRQHTIDFNVVCSKGTYIRTLCHDIGLKLGCYAHMTELRRTMSDPFNFERAVAIDDVNLEKISEHLVSIEDALSFMESIVLPDLPKYHKWIQNGVRIQLDSFKSQNQLKNTKKFYRIYVGHTFYGIAENTDKGLFMKKLL